MLFKRKIDLGITQAHRDIASSPAGYPFTPDLYRLEKYQLQLLFVTDGWLSDRHESFVIKELGENLGKAFSKDRFDFLIKSTDPFKTAVILPNEDGHRIMGEVWVVEGDAFVKLDKLKVNGLQSLRHRVDILYPYRYEGYVQNYDGYFTPDGQILPEALQGKKHWLGPEQIWTLECWMYQAHPSYWVDMVHQNPFFFDRVQRFEPKKEKTWLEKYYRYQNP